VTLGLRSLLLLGALGLHGVVLPQDPGDSLGVQTCNTGCQTTFSDCVDRCDGAVPCQASCKRAVEDCVKACTNPPPAPSGGAPTPVHAPKAKPGKGSNSKVTPRPPTKPGAH
jgi:hypothetical protein